MASCSIRSRSLSGKIHPGISPLHRVLANPVVGMNTVPIRGTLRPSLSINRLSSSNLRTSKPICVITKLAPAATFRLSFKYWGISSDSRRLKGDTTQPVWKLIGASFTPPNGALESRTNPWFIWEIMSKTWTESRSKTGLAFPMNPYLG